MPNPPLRPGVNVDHVATLRNARGGRNPDPVRAALAAIAAGADGITAHLREDRRHIRDDDMARLKAEIGKPLNFEMAATPDMLGIALATGPHAVCLVPERREELTTEGGLDVAADVKRLKAVIRKLHSAKIEVSAFIDADLAQVEAAHRVGAQTVELHTGTYANATTRGAVRKELARHARAAAHAHEAGLRVNAGHGLHYVNVREYIEDVPHLHTLNIGHAIISRALFVGLEEAIRKMLELLGSHEFAPNAD
jgi:pyridoxine 5-phosphate synthase